MGIREECVEAAARAMIVSAYGPGRDFTTNPFYAGELDQARLNAIAAFNAIVERLREPSPDMLHAGQREGSGQVTAHFTFGFPAHPAPEFKVGGERAIWQAMLSAIEEPEL